MSRSLLVWSGRGGQTGESLDWRQTDHPVCAEQGGFAAFQLTAHPPLLCEEGNASIFKRHHYRLSAVVDRRYSSRYNGGFGNHALLETARSARPVTPSLTSKA